MLKQHNGRQGIDPEFTYLFEGLPWVNHLAFAMWLQPTPEGFEEATFTTNRKSIVT